jgi:hypothetical protein
VTAPTNQAGTGPFGVERSEGGEVLRRPQAWGDQDQVIETVWVAGRVQHGRSMSASAPIVRGRT